MAVPIEEARARAGRKKLRSGYVMRNDDYRGLQKSIRRQRQMCIRDDGFTYEQLQTRGDFVKRALAAGDSPDFSTLIRQGVPGDDPKVTP